MQNGLLDIALFFTDAKSGSIQKSAIVPFTQEPWSTLRTQLGAQRFFYINQVHGNNGIVVTNDMQCNQQQLMSGDYLITNVPSVVLTIFTADCLPIVMYDNVNKAIALVHAGWRGSVAGVAIKAFKHMCQVFGTQAQNVHVFFGPSAQVCCYQVDEHFTKNIQEQISNDVYEKVLQKKKGDWYFDLPLFNALQLEAEGIKKEKITFSATSACTICNHKFYSYRRTAQIDYRQISVVVLKRN